MRVYLNDVPLELFPGMTVRHLLLAAGFTTFPLVHDEWGNEVGLDGALAVGMRLTTGAVGRDGINKNSHNR